MCCCWVRLASGCCTRKPPQLQLPESAVLAADEKPPLGVHGVHWHCYSEVVATWRGANLELCSSPENVAVICYTSGTTGVAKGVMLTHTAFHCQALVKLREVGFCTADVYLHTSPLCHIGTCSCVPSCLNRLHPLVLVLVCEEVLSMLCSASSIAGGLSSAFAVLLAGGTHVFMPQYSASAMQSALVVHQV